MNKVQTIDEYISFFPLEIQEILNHIRKAIREAAPEAEEKISYQMPAFAQHGILVYFAAFKDHIGFFPTAEGIEAFKGELNEYKISKGTIQFPLNKPIPYDLITRIVKHRIQVNNGNHQECQRNDSI
jgi:uncharacterized protein YdhG (YjbR/CyaY superfamily)